MRLLLAAVTWRQLSTSSCSKSPAAPLLAWLPMRITSLDLLGRVLLDQHEVPELRPQRAPRKRQPKAEDPVREDAVVAELDTARAERAEPALDLGQGGPWYSWKSWAVSRDMPCT